MPILRLALPKELRGPVEAALGGRGEGVRLLSPEMPEEARQRLAWQRLWLERRRGGGADAAGAEAALQDNAVRALLALVDRQADAVLLPQGAAGAAAWQLLEPRRGLAGCADIWLGQSDVQAAPFGWCEWQAGEAVSAAAGQLCTGTAEVARWAGKAARAVVVSFAGGKNPARAAAERFLATLGARAEVAGASLYSPYFYRNGELQARAMLEEVRRAARGLPAEALAVLSVPQLRGAELAGALRAGGGIWAGPLRAGAEAPAARLDSAASREEIAATCEWLRRAAAAG